MVSYKKKAISPVVATALLLVVAVVAVVGFQSWFTTYQSGINVKVEQESQAGSVITIERLERGTDGVTPRVYVKNGGTDPVVDATVSITGCTSANVNVSGQKVNSTQLSGCAALVKGEDYDVVVVTGSGVYQATMIAR